MVYYHKIVSFLTSKIIDSALHWVEGGGGMETLPEQSF